MAFQAISGLAGGALLVLDASGNLLGLPVSVLEGSPFKDFLAPGLILLAVLGVFPLITCYALWAKPKWRTAALIERWTGEHWAWAAAVTVSVALIIFLAVELLFVGSSFLLILFSFIGLGMLSLSVVPATKRYYG
jgi:hypothetical protein